MRKAFFTFQLLSILILFLGCNNENSLKSDRFKGKYRDLSEIQKEGVLRALTVYSSTTYFLYRGEPLGYEFEMLERFAEHLNVKLEMIIAKDMDELIELLNKGKADLLAHGLTVTRDRKKKVSFTDYLYLTHQVLVQKKPNNWRTLKWNLLENALIHDAIELIGDTVSLRKNSSYNERIINLSNELGGEIHINTLSGELSTDEIIKMVAEGKLKYTVADNNIAQIMASYHPVLDIEVPISFSQRIAWATRKKSPDLLSEVNIWLKSFKKNTDYYVIYNKYFKNKKDFRRREKSDFYSLNNQEISPYDTLIKKYSNEINWDWRLLTSMVYQESQFNPKSNSWTNASGLMQLMPETAKELGVTNRNDPEQSIKGGLKYLKQLYDKFDKVEDSIQRIKFTMASYNCGLYHVKDAQRLAKKRGLNPTNWDLNVEDMILELSLPKNYNDDVVKYGFVRGIEPYNYVNQIFERYHHYIQFIEK